MKKLIIIVVLFCLSAMTFKTEAELKKIPDKDFEEYFTNFQKELKKNKGNYEKNLENITHWSRIDLTRLEERACSKENNNSFSSILFLVKEFADILNKQYNLFCNMSQKNKYIVEKGRGWKTGHEDWGWSLDYIQDGKLTLSGYMTGNWDVEEVTINYGSSIYVLDYSASYRDDGGEGDYFLTCVFAKVDGNWKIVDLYSGGAG